MQLCAHYVVVPIYEQNGFCVNYRKEYAYEITKNIVSVVGNYYGAFSGIYHVRLH